MASDSANKSTGALDYSKFSRDDEKSQILIHEGGHIQDFKDGGVTGEVSEWPAYQAVILINKAFGSQALCTILGKSIMLRYALLISCLLLICACRDVSSPPDSAKCIPEWSNSAGIFPHHGDFIEISILDSKMASLNNAPPTRIEHVVELMASNAEYIKEFPIRVRVKDCILAKKLHIMLKKKEICLQDNCRYAPEWNFPS